MLEIRPVLTAHPTEARRRAVVDALRRIWELVERLDDTRLSAGERADAERGLREHVTILWRTAQLRQERPDPLDEVRSLMSIFDETLFRLVPLLYRELDRALAGPDESGRRPPAFPAFLRWGTWVGGDRDGNPAVDHEVTRAALEIQAEHILLGLEAATRRVGRSLTVSQDSTPPSAELLASLSEDEAGLGRRAAEIRQRSPGEPHRRKLLHAAEPRQVLETFRVMVELQARWGLEACRRYVVSFTRRPDDVLAVLTLARQAVPDGTLQVDPVPLFESRSDLEKATGVLDGLLDLPE